MTKLVYALCLFFTVYHLAYASGIRLLQMVNIKHHAIHVGLVLVLGFALYPAFKKSSRKTIAWYDWICIALSAVILLFRGPIVASYNLTGETFDLACWLLVYHSICVCTIWPMAFTLPNSFRAASDVKFTMILSVFSMWAFRIGLSYYLSGQFQLGFMSVWYAMAADWGFRAIVFTVHFFRGSWLSKYRDV